MSMAARLRLLHSLEERERALRGARAAAPEGADDSPAVDYPFLLSQIRAARVALTPGLFRRLPGKDGEPRIVPLARKIAGRRGDTAPVSETIEKALIEFQATAPLRLGELWALETTLKIALLEREDIENSTPALKALDTMQWREVVEEASAVERILREDPAGIYEKTGIPTREDCRRAVERIARRAEDGDKDEIDIARIAIDLARRVAAGGARRVEAHVGFYLLGRGVELLERRAGYRKTPLERARAAAQRHASAFYLGTLGILTALIAALAWTWMGGGWWRAALALLPASQGARALVNCLVNSLLPPRRLPRMDYSKGIPREDAAFVAVPSLLLSRRSAESLLERLETHYLANRDANLHFALLTDFPDSSGNESDTAALKACVAGIHHLNRRYGVEGRKPFYLFHRASKWNADEGTWMGPERKRGKLNDFNALLLGESDAFPVKVGDVPSAGSIRYVVTLDGDTQLPREAARLLVEEAAHPLNRPVSGVDGIVREGYAILQPRVSVGMESAARTRLANTLSGQTGLDPYASAVSDVYQDLMGRGSFTGKGIYDVAAFHAAAGKRFPDNALLSHDLLEGEYARVGFASDAEVIDDFPSSYESYCKRKHRWIRGDWQIAEWLLPRAPAPGRERVRNPLTIFSRWKIFDNLRRSLVEISLTALLAAGTLGFFHGLARTVLFAMAVLLLPAYAGFVCSLVRLPPWRLFAAHLRRNFLALAAAHREAAYIVALLPHQACLAADAIARTLYRTRVSRRRLLEWESMAQAETAAANKVSPALAWMYGSAALAAVLLVAAANPLLCIAWTLTPLTVAWLDARPWRLWRRQKEDDTEFLRGVALRTWRYFADFGAAAEHWLVPDNVQEEPYQVATRTSPTNLGLQLTAHLAAHRFGYLTHEETGERIENILHAMEGMERHRGHYFNWYDTRTLETIAPRYVSAVDSGNLAASLIALKQGCLAARKQPIAGQRILDGLRDHCLSLRASLSTEARIEPVMLRLSGLLRALEARPTGLFFWDALLREVRVTTRSLSEAIGRVANPGTEALAWMRILAERVEAAGTELSAFAPWLDKRHAVEFRMLSTDESMAALIGLMDRVPRIVELPEVYGAIGAAIAERLEKPEGLKPGGRPALEWLAAALGDAARFAAGIANRFESQAALAGEWVERMDFAFLHDRRRGLLHLGFDADRAALDPSHYDLLASEARSAVFLAIAKGDIPREAWFRLGRKFTWRLGERALLSWSGTMFEYLMPGLFMKSYAGTLLEESARGAVKIQRRYAALRNVPWGISEAAYAARDAEMVHQYRAFGVPHLAADPKCGTRLVVAPYASMLASMVDRDAAAGNLRAMAARGWLGPRGFYESADYGGRGGLKLRAPELGRTRMAHHQGMGLVALANTLLGGAIQEFFHADPMVMATEFLLQERLPAMGVESETEAEMLPAMGVESVAEGEMSGTTALEA